MKICIISRSHIIISYDIVIANHYTKIHIYIYRYTQTSPTTRNHINHKYPMLRNVMWQLLFACKISDKTRFNIHCVLVFFCVFFVEVVTVSTICAERTQFCIHLSTIERDRRRHYHFIYGSHHIMMFPCMSTAHRLILCCLVNKWSERSDVGFAHISMIFLSLVLHIPHEQFEGEGRYQLKTLLNLTPPPSPSPRIIR